MASKFGAWGQKIRQHLFITGIVVVLIAVIVLIIAVIISNGTGFNAYTVKSTATETTLSPQIKVTTTEQSQPGKKLWDLLQLLAALAIPVVVGFGVAWFTTQQAKARDRENKDNQREAALQKYIDSMSELLLHEKLRSSAEEYEVRTMARVRTLTVLRQLDEERKGSLLQFLYESGLIHKGKSIVDLEEADFNYVTVVRRSASSGRIRLVGANLKGALLLEAYLVQVNLSETILDNALLPFANLGRAELIKAQLRRAELLGANLSGADLSGADLSGSNLSGARLWQANLSNATLLGTYLIGADLSEADLSGADLSGANLNGANLSGASITTKQLEAAKNVTPKQHAQIRPPELAATQEAKTGQTSTAPVQSEIHPDQTGQEEETEQQEHKPPKQDTEAAH